MPAETTRRLAHVSGAAAAAAIQLLLTLPELVLLAAGFSLFLAVTAVSGRLRSIHGVGRRTLGAPLLPAGLLLAALTVVEACAGFGLDNLLVPVAGTLAGRAWLDL